MNQRKDMIVWGSRTSRLRLGNLVLSRKRRRPSTSKDTFRTDRDRVRLVQLVARLGFEFELTGSTRRLDLPRYRTGAAGLAGGWNAPRLVALDEVEAFRQL